MERSEIFIQLNSSSHSNKSKSSKTNSDEDNVKIDLEDLEDNHIIKLKDFINGSGSENYIFADSDSKPMCSLNNTSNISFSSTNSSILGVKSRLGSEVDPLDIRSLDIISSDNDLRSLFCLVLTKLDSLEDQLERQRNKFFKMKNHYDQKLKNINLDIDDIYDDINFLDSRLVKCEQYTRRESVVISGIPDRIPQAELEFTVLDILRGIGLDRISSFEISACHRLFKKHGDIFPAKTVVRFTNRKLAEFCLFNKDRLVRVSDDLRMNLRFFDSLCETNKEIIKMCNVLSKYKIIQEYKVIRGSIRVTKINETKQYKIIQPNELYKMFKEFYDYEDLYLI